MSLDYEAEYDNRARVPEAVAILERWARDAATFRLAHPPHVIPYGGSERQRIDLFAPDTHDGSHLVVFIHGGYWRALDRSCFSHLAAGLLQHGIAVAMPGYDLCPEVTLGAIVDQMRAACSELSRFQRRLVVAGHSAGGHLAACMLATDWRAVDSGLTETPVAAAFAISGLFDLAPLLHTSINDALRLDAAEAKRLSPIDWRPPPGSILDVVVGGNESSEFLRQSREIADGWGRLGVATRYEAIPGANHFTVVEPLVDPASGMTRRLAELARVESGSVVARPTLRYPDRT